MKSIKIILIFISFFMCHRSLAQNSVNANSANVKDPRLMFVNPAGINFDKNPLFVAGHQSFYTGLGSANLGNGFIGFLYPLKTGTIGITGQSFYSPILQLTHVDLNYAFALISDRLWTGFNVGLFNLSYNRDNFNLMDANDPLLEANTSKLDFNCGAGLIAKPFKNVYIGASFNHLNRPEWSLEDGGWKKSPKQSYSLLYNYRFLSPMIQWNIEDEIDYPSIGIESWLLNQNVMLRGTLSREQYGLGAAACVHDFRIDYIYENPVSDLNQIAGSLHQFVLSYTIGLSRPDFTIKAQPIDPVDPIQDGIYLNQRATFKLQVIPQNEFDRTIRLFLKKVPDNLKIHLNKHEFTIDEHVDLIVEPETDCIPELYTFKVRGKARSASHAIDVSVKIKPLPRIRANVQSEKDTVIVKEVQDVSEENPVINYVFFDENEFELNEKRYQIINPQLNPQHDFVFFTENITTIREHYRNTLNIVAKRLLDDPSLAIQLVGCNSNWGAEQGNLELSRKRAENVKKYFVDNLKVPESQITVKVRNLPKNPSAISDPLGREENRRVEIIPVQHSKEVIDPVYTQKIRNVVSDSLCIFNTTESMSEAGVKKWKLDIKDSDFRDIQTITGKDSLPGQITWDWKDKNENPIEPNKNYYYRLEVKDKIGQSSDSDWKTINVGYQYKHKVRPTKKVEKTRLILFEFDKDDIEISTKAINESLEKIVEKVIMNPKATVRVKGYTDIIGDSDYNQKLSERRAYSIYQKLVHLGVPHSKIEYMGYGPNSPLMNNDLPEGRMMNRRVEVIVTAPIE